MAGRRRPRPDSLEAVMDSKDEHDELWLGFLLFVALPLALTFLV